MMAATHIDPVEAAFLTAKSTDLAFLSDLGPMILAASYLGLAQDSRGFARKFEQPHALVLREISCLIQDLGLLEDVSSKQTSSRVFYRLLPAGHALFKGQK